VLLKRRRRLRRAWEESLGREPEADIYPRYNNITSMTILNYTIPVVDALSYRYKGI
jgi:hypothetical protein